MVPKVDTKPAAMLARVAMAVKPPVEVMVLILSKVGDNFIRPMIKP